MCLFILSSPLAPASSPSGEQMDCLLCHGRQGNASSVHSELGCIDCHPNITTLPHHKSDRPTRSGEETCSRCHERYPRSSTSVHTNLGCQACHGPAHQIPAASEATCAHCHSPVTKALELSVHGGIAPCRDCHGNAHAILGRADLASWVSPVSQIHTCGRCHDSRHEITEGYLTSVHAKALLASGLISAPACSDCHGSHGILTSTNPAAKTSHTKVPETCGTCHVLILIAWTQESAHGLAWKKGAEGPVCTTCHISHAIAEPTAFPTRLGFPERCGECHEEWYLSFRDTFHGKSTDLGYMSSAICSDCHTPHKNLPADDPGSSVHPTNIGKTCGACHGPVPASFLSFDPHNDPSNPNRSREVHYIWLFMTALLLTVFGFFGIHDLLWLQRSLVGALRGEFKKEGAHEGPYIRRFAKVHIWTHVVIIVSFLLLAATGLPLKFHTAPWAQVLIDIFGGVDSARTLHHLAAIATFGYALFHVLYILYLAVSGSSRRLLWGPASLAPQPKDFTDLFRNLRYFLYLGPRPTLDRWTYWEKFDYLAVFWGVFIIGLSGLVLWFPELFSQFLPGWTLNAAYMIHSDEALLATGFIFVFHFFHTHLRPESFPMDPVIFTGRMSLARFKQERPFEYQRLVECNQLDAHLVPAPTRTEVRKAFVFGLSALAIGILLAAAIFWAVIQYSSGEYTSRRDALELLIQRQRGQF